MATTVEKPRSLPASKQQRFIINVALADDNEPRKIFVGADGSDFLIERGKDTINPDPKTGEPRGVPISVLDILNNAVKGVPEVDPEDPDKVIFVERMRFPYTVVQAL